MLFYWGTTAVSFHKRQLSQCMRFQTMWYMWPAKPQISLCICAVWSEPLLMFEYFMIVKLMIEHYLEFLSLTGGCTGLSESTLVKIPHCWISHAMAQSFSIKFFHIILSLPGLHVLTAPLQRSTCLYQQPSPSQNEIKIELKLRQ